MSGIVGSYFNTRGSGVVAKLGSDGQVFTSTGAGLSQGFETASAGIFTDLAVDTGETANYSHSNTSWHDAGLIALAFTGLTSGKRVFMHVMGYVYAPADPAGLPSFQMRRGSTSILETGGTAEVDHWKGSHNADWISSGQPHNVWNFWCSDTGHGGGNHTYNLYTKKQHGTSVNIGYGSQGQMGRVKAFGFVEA